MSGAEKERVFEVDSSLVEPGVLALGRQGGWKASAGGPDAIRLHSNENPLGPSPAACAALRGSIAGVSTFPDCTSQALTEALADRHGVSPSQVVVGHGSTEIIQLLVRAFVRPGETVVCPWPSFVMFRLAAQATNREVLTAPLRGFRVDLAAVAGLVDQRAKIVFLANPNNPTGTYLRRRELSAFLDRLPPHVIVALDEAYFEFVTASDFPDGIAAMKARKRVVVLRTFSKIFGLAGIRLGYGVMESELSRFVHAVRGPYNVSGPAQAAGLAALRDVQHLERSQELVRRERARLSRSLNQLGFEVCPSQANFLCVRSSGPAQGLVQELRDSGILVASLDAYDLPDCFRVSVGCAQANDRLLEALTRLRSLDPLGTGTE